MTTIILTDNQALKLVHNPDDELRISRNGIVYYITRIDYTDDGKSVYEVKTWSGIEKDVIVINPFEM